MRIVKALIKQIRYSTDNLDFEVDFEIGFLNGIYAIQCDLACWEAEFYTEPTEAHAAFDRMVSVCSIDMENACIIQVVDVGCL